MNVNFIANGSRIYLRKNINVDFKTFKIRVSNFGHYPSNKFYLKILSDD